MLQYEFDLEYTSGEENAVADFLSRNAENWIEPDECLAAIQANSDEMRTEQIADDEMREVMRYLNLSHHQRSKQPKRLRSIAENCFLSAEGVLMKKLQLSGREREVLWPPRKMRQPIIDAAHFTIEAVHGGRDRTINRIKLAYWWPGISVDVDNTIKNCETCQLSKSKPPAPLPLQSMPIPRGPNNRVHIDLMGPLKTSENGNKYIMVMTDAFTKWVELAAITDKTATTIGQQFFEKWICRFAAPLCIITDQGKEFNNKILKEICDLWNIDKRRTSPFHPQTNSSAESYNRSLLKYLRALLLDTDHTTLDWENLLTSAAFAYNYHIHKSTKESPFFLTYLHDPRLPYFDLGRPRRFTDDSFVHETFMIAQNAYLAATENMQTASEIQKKYYDRKVKDREVRAGERVMVYFPNAPPKSNPKLHSHWKMGSVIKMIGNLNVLVALDSTKKASLVHLNRVKAIKTKDASVEESNSTRTQPPANQRMSELPHLNFNLAKEMGWDSDDMDREEVTRWIRDDREARAVGQEEDEADEQLRGEDDYEPLIQIFRRQNDMEWSVSPANSFQPPPDSTTDDIQLPDEEEEESDELNTPRVSPLPPPTPKQQTPDSPQPGPSHRVTPPNSPQPGPSHRVTPPPTPPNSPRPDSDSDSFTTPPQSPQKQEEPKKATTQKRQAVRVTYPEPQEIIVNLKKKKRCGKAKSSLQTPETVPVSQPGPLGNLAAAVFPGARPNSSGTRYLTRSCGPPSGQEWVQSRPLERKQRKT